LVFFQVSADVITDLEPDNQNRLSIYRRSYSSHIINIFIFFSTIPLSLSRKIMSDPGRSNPYKGSNFQ